MHRRLLFAAFFVAALVASVLAALVLPARADHDVNTSQGIEEVGFHNLENTGFNTDVWPWRSQNGRLYAAVGTWGTLLADDPCPSKTDNPLLPTKSGVKIVDATDPANPVLVERIATFPGSQNNDPKEDRIEIEGGFHGDILSHSLEPCGADLVLELVIPDLPDPVEPKTTGVQLYDVSDPANPVRLGTYNNGALGTHNHYIVPRPDLNRAFIAVVWNSQTLLEGVRIGEIQILEITDPTGGLDLTLDKVASWTLSDAEVQGGPAVAELCKPRGSSSAFCFLHDVWPNEDGTILYLSYWDAGLVLLDITDPESPTFVGQIQDQAQLPADPEGWLNEEGNTHAAVPMFVDGKHLVVVGDEDFVGPTPSPAVTIDKAPPGAAVTVGENLFGSEFTDTRPLTATEPSLPVVVADDVDQSGCVWTSGIAFGAAPGGGPWIGVSRRGGTCATFQQKVSAAEIAGASGIIVANNVPGGTSVGTAVGTIPGLMITLEDGNRLIASIDNLMPKKVEVTMHLVATEDNNPWGFMRVVDVSDSDPANWREVSQFRAPHVDDPFDQPPESIFSAHNPIVGPDGRVYFAWYTDGVRVLDVTAGGTTVKEVGWFVPRPSDHEGDNDQDPRAVLEDHAGFWGSHPICHPNGDLLVFNSDINRGLYILKVQLDDRGACRAPPPPPTGGGKTTGGGWLEDRNGKKINFGFNAKEASGGLSGYLQLNDKGGSVKIHVTTITALGEVGERCGSVPRAPNGLEFRGVGRFNGADGAEFRVCVQDNGEGSGGAADLFYLTCLGGCSYSTNSNTADDAIDGGNIQVHKPASPNAEGDQPATMILDPLLLTDGVVGAVQLFTVTVYDQNQEPLANAGVTLQRVTSTGLVETLTGITGGAGIAVFAVVNLADVTEYIARAGAAMSNAIEVTPLQARLGASTPLAAHDRRAFADLGHAETHPAGVGFGTQAPAGFTRVLLTARS